MRRCVQRGFIFIGVEASRPSLPQLSTVGIVTYVTSNSEGGGIGRRDSWIDHFSSNIQYCGNLYFFAGFQDILSFPILQDLKIPFVLRQVCLTLPKYREFSHFASISAFSFSKISTFLEIQISKNIFKIPKISKKSQNRQKNLQRFKALSIFSQVNCPSPAEH